MFLYKNNSRVDTYSNYYSGKNIVIAIDSSKSNTAIVVGNEYGTVLDDYEISGAGTEIDVYQLCWDTRKQLKKLFDGSNIIAVGIEDIITKKTDNNFKGLDIHQSRAKITAVFNNIIFSFQEYFNITPMFINNNTWKSYALPSEYRTREHKKGSKDYFKAMGSSWGNRADDVTDAVCILEYMYSIIKVKVINKIDYAVPTKKPYSFGLYPVTTNMPKYSKEFEFNSKFTVEQNLESMVELLCKEDKYGYIKVRVEDVPIKWLYDGHLKNSYEKNTKHLLLVSKIKEV